MIQSPRGRRRAAGHLAGAALLTLLAGGCGVLLLEPTDPKTARVSVQAAVATQARVMVSTRFNTLSVDRGGIGIDLLDADTMWVTLPFTTTYDIDLTKRFFFRVFEVEPTLSEVTMQVQINSEPRYDRSRVVDSEDLETRLEFVFLFSGEVGERVFTP